MAVGVEVRRRSCGRRRAWLIRSPFVARSWPVRGLIATATATAATATAEAKVKRRAGYP
ncbi:hypothetical protein X946_5223 [Burkholderia sp. ABCPW 111]|nr:hypothetical protein X946_5223 [Burkholderia sp. ABCPW 111]